MKLAIMQPYLFPYIGYFQLIHAVNTFVVYDNIKYTKKGWINRNRMLSHGKESLFSVPLAKGADSLHVVERTLAADFDRDSFIRSFREGYHGAPFLRQTMEVLEEAVLDGETNLFEFLTHSIKTICRHLNIDTKFKISSQIPIDHSLTGKDKVIAISKNLEAEWYINPIGGRDLYTKDEFAKDGLKVAFIKSIPVQYDQRCKTFVPWLSILDVLMFNGVEKVVESILSQYDLIDEEEGKVKLHG